MSRIRILDAGHGPTWPPKKNGRKDDGEIDRLYAATDDSGRRTFSKSMMYRFAGNAVCVDCFVRITEQILDDMEHPHSEKNGLDYWMAME